MATPRKRIRTRDKESTMRQFLNAIGTILRKEGFGGLKVNRIARQTGKDKTLIARYFTDLAGLQRAYISEKDYWMPFFERFVLTDSSGILEVQEIFIALMQENFKFFHGNPEMQNIILWQISEANALVSEISNEREDHGEKLFQFTDHYFSGTGINFRAVIALLLGGTYFMILQARTGNSKVSGIDLNLPSDQIELLGAIDHIITWACEKAIENPPIKSQQTQSSPMMNYQFELLETFAAQLLASSKPETAPADAVLKSETKKLSRSIPHHVMGLSNDTQILSYIKTCMTKLTEVCDLLYQPDRKTNADAELIVELILSVSKTFGDVIPDGVTLPKLFCKNAALRFNEKWQLIKKNLEKLGAHPFLTDIIHIPFKEFGLAGNEMSWYDYKYLKLYAAKLESESFQGLGNQSDVMDLLVGLGMNHPRFCAYCSEVLKKRTEGQPEMIRINLLLEAQTAIGQISSRTDLSYLPGKMTIVAELVKWIDLEMKREYGILSKESDVPDQNRFSLQTDLNSAQLAFWQKLQYDHGIYTEPTLDIFSDKIAYNFKTKNGTSPSGISVKSKLYAKIEVNYKPLEEKLEKMLEEVRLYGA